ELAMTERTYRLWDYSASHARLVVRAVADEQRPENDDHVFAGVKFVSMPEAIFALTVRQATKAETADAAWLETFPRDLIDSTKVFLLTGFDAAGQPVLGAIFAADYRRELNERPFYETVLHEGPSAASSALQFEKEVIAALAALPGLHISIAASD